MKSHLSELSIEGGTGKLRSRIMRAVKSSDTGPERIVDGWLKSARFRPLANHRALPGTPDFVLGRRRIAIFVHGCFWHGHGCKRGSRRPVANRGYWLAKLAANRRRDARVRRELRAMGWLVVTVWECRTVTVAHRLSFLRRLRQA